MSSEEITVQLDAGKAVTALVYRAESDSKNARVTLILGHGAGAGQRSSFMVAFARALEALGVDAVTFDFPYMQEKRRVPDRGPILESCYRKVISSVATNVAGHGERLFIGGKSMGGRIATQVAAADPQLAIAGLVLLGYPLHPPGAPDKRRDQHLPAIARPVLFVQGSRDTFGTPEELEPAVSAMRPTPTLHVVANGDHSFKVREKDSKAQQEVYSDIQRVITTWMTSIVKGR
ncbi:MAG TPA: alpha/beta fold hydrolase [Vicinamibacterales bacterium]|nr:alpha/beta fold hydrolase [Vicinamibacterales bacterium]